MDISSVTASSQLLQSSQTQQALSVSMVKQAANAQNQVAAMLAQNVKQGSQPAQSQDYGFSTMV